ncbi:MAG TPA: RsmD family RNA methyltransferase [Methylocella sp.]|nr:RsmD family RNA methyltransferase [Methylocella sp.]
MRENIENCLAQAVRGRPDRVGTWAFQRPAFQPAADNPHGASRFAARAPFWGSAASSGPALARWFCAARILRRDARKLGAATEVESFSLAFLDPPYRKGLVPPTLKALRDGGWLGKGALVVIEEHAGADVDLPESFVSCETRRFGATQIVFARFT